jgi:hypothetical protein
LISASARADEAALVGQHAGVDPVTGVELGEDTVASPTGGDHRVVPQHTADREDDLGDRGVRDQESTGSRETCPVSTDEQAGRASGSDGSR